jgi:hypothetical protein
MSRNSLKDPEIVPPASAVLSLGVALALLATACGPAPRTYLSSELHDLRGFRIALLPLDNLTLADGASQKMDQILLVELLRLGAFDVADPGDVEKVLLDLRIRRASQLSLQEVNAVSEELEVRALMVGSILEYGTMASRPTSGGPVPTISITLRMIHGTTGEIIWAASHSRTGDDAEKVFGIGRTVDPTKLSKDVAREILRALGSFVAADR